MIGLVFGFFFAVCLLIACLWIFGALFESGAIWWVIIGIVVFFIWTSREADKNNKAYEAKRAACITEVNSEYALWPHTQKNYQVYLRKHNNCGL